MNVKECLQNYRFFVENVKALETEIKILREEADGLKGIDYSREKVQTSTISNTLENIIVKISEKEMLLKKKKLVMNVIDTAVNELEEIENRIIHMKYLDKNCFRNTWQKIALTLMYTERQCRRKRDSAFKKIEVALEGII